LHKNKIIFNPSNKDIRMSHIVSEKDIEAEIMEVEDACPHSRTRPIEALNLSPELLEKVC
jgi:hypothetical protein